MKCLALLFLCCGLAVGQTAKVIALEPSDAAKSKELHESADKAKKALDEFDKHIEAKYTLNVCANCTATYKSGWATGFEYSDDWLYIVPRALTGITTAPVWTVQTCPSGGPLNPYTIIN